MSYSEIIHQLGDEYFVPLHLSMYLESNDAPHDIDIEDVTNSLREISQSIEQVDEVTKELSRAIKTLQMRRAAMLETQSKLHAVLSPLRRFPPEILNEIFEHSVKSGYSILETTLGPWSLSHVSHCWRDTALTCSGALWSNLYICIDRYSCLKNDPLSLLRTCLARSHGHDISVNFVHSNPAPNFEDKAIKMFQLLVDHCEHWHSFEFSNESLEIDRQLNNVHGRLLKLENLIIHSGPHNSEAPTTAFAVAPHLRTVKIHGGSDVVLGSGNPRLISYEDYRSTPTDILDPYLTTIHSCRHLQTFTSFHQHTSLESHAANPQIIVPWLRHFRGSHRDLIRSLTAPNLESMHLDPARGKLCPITSLLNIHDLFIRSRCRSLSKLVISHAIITRHILDILLLAPALIILQFQISRWEDKDAEEEFLHAMFQQMTDIDDSGTHKVVPDLREFSFAAVSGHTSHRNQDLNFVKCIDGTFLEMVTSRAQTLTKVDIRAILPRSVWSLENMSLFEGLRKGGMDILFGTRTPYFPL